MACRVPYIENRYRSKYPKLADRLNQIHDDIKQEIKKSKLFRDYSGMYLFSAEGTKSRQSQLDFISKINDKYGTRVIYPKLTKSGKNEFAAVNVVPLEKSEFDKLQGQQYDLFNQPQDIQEEEPISEEEYLKSIPSEEDQWFQDYMYRQESGEENWVVNEEGDIISYDDAKKYSLSHPELRLYKSISEKFDSDISELNEYNLRELYQQKTSFPEGQEYLKNSKFSKGYVLNLGNPSSVLRKIGVPNLPITLGSNWFLDHIIRNPEHNLKLLNFKGLVEAIQNPIAIFIDKDYRGRSGRMEFVTTIKSRNGMPTNVIIQLDRQFGELSVNNILTSMESADLFRFRKATIDGDTLYVDKERITNFLEGVQSQVSSLQRHILNGKLVYPKTISDSDTNIQKFLYKVNQFPDILSDEDKRYQQVLSTLLREDRGSLQEGLDWLKTVFPNANISLVNGLIDNIAKGSYNTVTDLIQASIEFADKGTIKHETGHNIFNWLPKSEQEKILNEGSKLFGIPRGESKTTLKYSQAQQNEVQYTLRSIDTLNNLTPKQKQEWNKWQKGTITAEQLVDRLQIPKEQKQLLIDELQDKSVTPEEVAIKRQVENIKFSSPRLKYEGDLAIEEKIMERLEKSPDSYHPSTVIGKFFKAIKDFLRDIFGQRDKVQRFIDDINNGRYRDLQRPENSNTNEQVKYSKLIAQQSKKSGIFNLIIKNNENFEKPIYESELNKISNLILNKLKIKNSTYVSKILPDIKHKDDYIKNALKELTSNIGLPDVNSISELEIKLHNGDVLNYINQNYNYNFHLLESLNNNLPPSKETLLNFLRTLEINEYDEQQQDLIKKAFPALFGNLGRYKSYNQALSHYKIKVRDFKFLNSVLNEFNFRRRAFFAANSKLKKFETLINYHNIHPDDFKKRIVEFINNEIKRRGDFYDSAPVKEHINSLIKQDIEKKYQNSIKGILERLSINEKTVSGRLAKVFLNHKNTLSRINSEQISRNQFALGGSWSSNGDIIVNYSDENGLKHTLLHEITHHFSVPYLHTFYKDEHFNKEWYKNNPERLVILDENFDEQGKYFFDNLSEDEILNMKKIDSIYTHVVDLYKSGKIDFESNPLSGNPIYGLTNTLEFVAEALSNPYFAAKLAQLPSIYNQKSNLLKEFIEALFKLLKINNDNNLLSDVYSLFEETFLNKDDKYVFGDKLNQPLNQSWSANISSQQSAIPQDYQSFKQSLFTIDTNPELINKGDELIDENGDRCKL